MVPELWDNLDLKVTDAKVAKGSGASLTVSGHFTVRFVFGGSTRSPVLSDVCQLAHLEPQQIRHAIPWDPWQRSGRTHMVTKPAEEAMHVLIIVAVSHSGISQQV